MKDTELKQLFADLHTKFDQILKAIGEPVTPQQQQQKQTDIPQQTTSTTQPPQQPAQDTTIETPKQQLGFYEINTSPYPGHVHQCFQSTINGKPNPLKIIAKDPEVYIDFEMFKDYVISENNDTIQGNLIKVGQVDNTQEIDIDNLKVQGLILAGMTVAIKIRSYDELNNQIKGEIIEIDILD